MSQTLSIGTALKIRDSNIHPSCALMYFLTYLLGVNCSLDTLVIFFSQIFPWMNILELPHSSQFSKYFRLGLLGHNTQLQIYSLEDPQIRCLEVVDWYVQLSEHWIYFLTTFPRKRRKEQLFYERSVWVGGRLATRVGKCYSKN